MPQVLSKLQPSQLFGVSVMRVTASLASLEKTDAIRPQMVVAATAVSLVSAMSASALAVGSSLQPGTIPGHRVAAGSGIAGAVRSTPVMNAGEFYRFLEGGSDARSPAEQRGNVRARGLPPAGPDITSSTAVDLLEAPGPRFSRSATIAQVLPRFCRSVTIGTQTD